MSEMAIVNVPDEDWLDLYADPSVIALGITPGTSIFGQNVDESWVYIKYGSTKPDEESIGEIITSVEKNYAYYKVPAGENNIWVKAKNDGGNAKLSVRLAPV